MKKIIALLLSVVILTQTLCLNAVDSDAKPQAVQIPCQYAIVDEIKTGTVNGYLIDGGFYVDLSVIEMLTGFTASQKDAETVLWKEGSSIFYRLNPESGQIIRMASNEVRWNVEIKRLDDGKQVINFEEILRAMNVQIAIDENSNYPLCTYLPYTVHDAWNAFSSVEYRPNLFSWTEIEEDQGENTDPQTLGVLSAINSLYLDYNDHFITDAIFSWWSEDILNVTEEDISDTMMEILLCLSDDRSGVFGSNQLYKTFKQDNKTIGLVSRMLKFFNIDEEINNISSVMGKGSSVVGKELTVIDVINTISQYKAIQETQRDILNELFVNSPIYSSAEDPTFKHIYNAAKYLSQRVRDDGVGTTSAICDGVIDVFTDILSGAISDVTPVLVLEKTMATIMKTIPGLSDLADINKRIHVGCLSWALLELSVYNYNDCVDNIRNYTFPSTEDMTRLRLVMLFEIMSSLTARENFIKTKVIKEETVKSMEQKNKKLIELYAMVISSKPITAPADNSGVIDWNNFVELITNKHTDTAELLQRKLQDFVGNQKIYAFVSDDFDGDGSMEAFGAIGECFGMDTLYFVTKDTIEVVTNDGFTLYDDEQDYNHLIDCIDEKFYVIEQCYGGSGSASLIFGVKNGKWYKHSFSGVGSSLRQDERNKEITIIEGMHHDSQTKDGVETGGNTLKTYYLYYDHEFLEYGGIKISEAQLMVCDGAKEIVDLIKNSGCNIGDIFYRENGIISVNYNKYNYESGYTDNAYITLKLNDTSVTPLIMFPDSETQLGRISNGGIYPAAFLPDIATYPAKFPLDNEDINIEGLTEPYNLIGNKIQIMGAWDSEDKKQRIIFGMPTEMGDTYWTMNGPVQVDGKFEVVDLERCRLYNGAYIISNKDVLIVYVEEDGQQMGYKIDYFIDEKTLSLHGKKYSAVSTELLNQLIGTWESDSITYDFDEYHTVRVTIDGETNSGYYFIIDENTILLREGIGDLYKWNEPETVSYIIENGYLQLEDSPKVKNITKNRFYKDIEKIKSNLIGVWNYADDYTDEYYEFFENGIVYKYTNHRDMLDKKPFSIFYYTVETADEIRLYIWGNETVSYGGCYSMTYISENELESSRRHYKKYHEKIETETNDRTEIGQDKDALTVDILVGTWTHGDQFVVFKEDGTFSSYYSDPEKPSNLLKGTYDIMFSNKVFLHTEEYEDIVVEYDISKGLEIFVNIFFEKINDN